MKTYGETPYLPEEPKENECSFCSSPCDGIFCSKDCEIAERND